MLTGPQLKFCEAIAGGMNGIEAVMAAYPKAGRSTARGYAPKLRNNPEIKAEIARLRGLAQEKAGSAVMMLIEKRKFLARVVRARIKLEPEDSDLWQCIKWTKHCTIYRLPDKIAAIVADNDLDPTINERLARLEDSSQ